MKRYIRANTVNTFGDALDRCIEDAIEGDRYYNSVRVILDQKDIIYDGQSLAACKIKLADYLDYTCKYDGWYDDGDIEFYVFSPRYSNQY